MKRAFKVKLKTFFLVSQVPSLRLTKQTSKNVADTTFNLINQQPDTDKTYSYAKVSYEAKYQFLITKTESTGLSLLIILKLLLNTQMIWMLFIKMLKNITQIKNIKY